MRIIRKKRVAWIIFFVSGASIAIGLLLFALRQNISLYYTPSQINDMKSIQFASHSLLRLGGFVKENSVYHQPHSLKVQFAVTDYHHTIWVHYDGILPSLFHVNQGIVVQGHFKNGIFYANQVLAKHDATYHPPELAQLNSKTTSS